MQAYSELIPPTAVTHAVSLAFTSATSDDLVIAKTSLLQVFRVETLFEQENGHARQSSKLVLISEHSLSGTVTALAKVKCIDSRSGGEVLLIATRDAKISLVEWDPENHTIATISIHYYEGEDAKAAPWTADLSQETSYLTVDPGNRCAALKYGQRQLAILPFRQPGDDLVAGDDDPDADVGETLQRPGATSVDAQQKQTPYRSSFVLSLTVLDPSLIFPVDMAFLYEYREPTLGILSSAKATSAGLNAEPERRDLLCYSVITLDIEQRARTPLLSVAGLPNDLFRLIPLPLPIGGVLLVGGNELIHVDQSGKCTAIAVNGFAKLSSSFAMLDRSDLDMKLEGCVIEHASKSANQMLIVLRTGYLAVLTFTIEGRSVSNMTVRHIDADKGGSSVRSSATCAALVRKDIIFVGSANGNSVLLQCAELNEPPLTRKRSHAAMLGNDAPDSDEEEVDEVDEDDLYAHDSEGQSSKQSRMAGSSNNSSVANSFVVQDQLPCLAPMKDLIIGRSRTSSSSVGDSHPQELELVAPICQGRAGAVAFMSRDIRPANVARCGGIARAQGVWTLRTKQAGQENTNGTKYDDFVIISDFNDQGAAETSRIYTIRDDKFEEIHDGDFERDSATINAGTLAGASRIVQVSRSELRCYDADLGLSQIVPMLDEDTDAELKIVTTSFADPYLLVLRDDSSIVILKADASGDVEELDRGEGLMAKTWLSGSVYKSSTAYEAAPLLYLLNAEGALQIYELPHLDKPVHIAESLSFLPPTITPGIVPRRSAARETLTEILVADLGSNGLASPYLIVRTALDELTIYDPYHYPSSYKSTKFTDNLRWRKVPNPHMTRYSEDDNPDFGKGASAGSPLRAVTLGIYKAIYVPGSSPSLILKDPSSLPKVLTLAAKGLRGFSSIHTASCPKGWLSANAEGTVSTATLPDHSHFAQTGWAVRTLPVGRDVDGIAYHASSGLYVFGVNDAVEFQIPQDDLHRDWPSDVDTRPRPTGGRGRLQLFDPESHTVIHDFLLAPSETLLCLVALTLETSEHTHERADTIVVGTGMLRGEDLPSDGSIYAFGVHDVVAQPGLPATSRALRQVAREEARGAVTALSGVGTQGFVLAAQGQKAVVRGLKEDGTLLPVAFLDLQCHVAALRGLPGCGLALVADAVKGVWFAAFSDDPLRLTLLGKGRARMQLAAAEFLPYDRQLYILAADTACDLHVLEYNPEHPKSLGGQRLLHRSSFHTGHAATTLLSLPSTLSPAVAAVTAPVDRPQLGAAAAPPLHQTLLATRTGALALLVPLDEHAYRRLGALQTHLASSALEHAGALNPRAYRSAIGGGGAGGGGVIVDGALVRRWEELGSQRRVEACARVGVEAWVLRSDLEVLGGAGLGFL